MIKVFVLCHPQSKDIIKDKSFDYPEIQKVRIACGTTKPKRVDLYESTDFSPTFASWNSSLFETSVILTIWKHRQALLNGNDIAILHTDTKMHKKRELTWNNLLNALREDPERPIGLTVNVMYKNHYSNWLLPDKSPFHAILDPMRLHAFDSGIYVYDIIKKYDPDIYQYAKDTNPKMIYSHQFACSYNIFEILGSKLYEIAKSITLEDVGFWTPHVFERLIALYLAQLGSPLLTTAFWHYSSSGSIGPGALNLYGPRAFKYYQIASPKSDSVSKLKTQPRLIRKKRDASHRLIQYRD